MNRKSFMLLVLVVATTMAQTIWDGTADTTLYNDPLLLEYTITTAEQLAGLAVLIKKGKDFSKKTIKLGANIMLNDTIGWGDWNTKVGTKKIWVEIGDSAKPFNGKFDGNGHIISGMYICDDNRSYQGLFGHCGAGAEIRNIRMFASLLGAREKSGGLVGFNKGKIINSCFRGLIFANQSFISYNSIGGLVGINGGIIDNSYSVLIMSYGTGTANYSGAGKGFGGFVGVNKSGTITNCYSTGRIDLNYCEVGGFVGEIAGGNINKCYTSVVVNAYGNNIGGFVGNIHDDGEINNCYATGNVDGGRGSSRNIGGFVGNIEYSKISNSYSTGNVDVIGIDGSADVIGTDGSAQNAGGFVGNIEYSNISNSYSTGNVDVMGGYSNAIGRDSYIGGFAGESSGGTFFNSYSAGTVIGRFRDGTLEGSEGRKVIIDGFIGNEFFVNGDVIRCYYDKETYNQTETKTSASVASAKTTEYMQSQEFVDLLNSTASIFLGNNRWVYKFGEYPTLDSITAEVSNYFTNGAGTQENPYIINNAEQLAKFLISTNCGGQNFKNLYIKLGADIYMSDTTNWKDWNKTNKEVNWFGVKTFKGDFNGDGHAIIGVVLSNNNNNTGLFRVNEGTIRNLGVVAYRNNIDPKYSINYRLYLGCLAAENMGTIANCYSVGMLLWPGTERLVGTYNTVGDIVVGGLVGLNEKLIVNCYAMVDINVKVSDPYKVYVGGLIGENRLEGRINNCYSTGKIIVEGNAGYYVGGLLGGGYHSDSGNNNYYSNETSGQSNGVGYFREEYKGIENKTVNEMKQKQTYKNWDFDSIWNINVAINDGYPFLRKDAISPVPIKTWTIRDKKQGILIKNNPITADFAEIRVIVPENEKLAEIKLAIYDNVGNIVFEKTEVRKDVILWNLTNAAGRKVANGSYLVVVEATTVNKKVYRYSAKVGVKK